jgi:hypothetical protein
MSASSLLTQRSIVLVVPNFFSRDFLWWYTSFIDYLRQVRLRYDAKLDCHRTQQPRQERASLEHDQDARGGAGAVPPLRQRAAGRERRCSVVPAGSAVLSYSAETHRFAARVADKLKTVPIFFIQEYEPDFHPAGDMRTFA